MNFIPKFKSQCSNQAEEPFEVSSKDILAFRTILAMLIEVLPLAEPIETGKKSRYATQEQKDELKILSALATILVMEHEVVAVVAKKGDGDVEVVASSNMGVKQEDKSTSSYLDKLWNLWATINPSRTRLDHLVNPRIINSKEIGGFPANPTLCDLKKYHLEHW